MALHSSHPPLRWAQFITRLLELLSEIRKILGMVTQMSALPPPYLDARFSDVSEMCTQVSLWDLDLLPLSRISESKGAGRIVQRRIHDLEIGHCNLGASFDQHGSAPPGVFTFTIKGADTEQLWWRGMDTSGDEVLVFQPGSELRSTSSAEFSIHTLSTNREAIAGICESMKIDFPREGRLRETFPIDSVRRKEICRIMDGLRDQTASPSVATLSGILESLVQTWVAPADTQPRGLASFRARDRTLRTCLEYLEEADLSGITASDLRRVSGVSERTLQYAFLERFQASPMAFVKARRLTSVRRLLLSPDLAHRSIGDLAATMDFWHQGHFNEDYRRLFSETPSDTRSRAKNV